MDEIEEMLQLIERELANGKRPLFGAGVTVDSEAVYSAVERIRAAVPQAVREARIVLRDSEKRMEAESGRAREIIRKAEERADEILSEHQIVARAEKEAALIRRQAEAYAEKVRADAYNELMNMLVKADESLSGSLDLVRQAIKKIGGQ